MTAQMDEVARVFELGAIRSLLPVAGGLSNEMWHVRTDRGEFAVQVMRVDADSPDFPSNVETAFLIEAAAFAKGLPCPEPVPLPEGRCLARAQGSWVRVHRRGHGTLPTPGEHSGDAAALMASIHADAPTTVAPLDDEPWDVVGQSSLADQPGMPGDLVDALRAAAPSLAGLESETSEQERLDVHVLSHGDLDPKDTLLVDGTLMAVDWDAAGPRSRVREAVSIALDWTSRPRGFRAAIDAYTSAGGADIPAEPWVFGGWVGAKAAGLSAMRCTARAPNRGETRSCSRRSGSLPFKATCPSMWPH